MSSYRLLPTLLLITALHITDATGATPVVTPEILQAGYKVITEPGANHLKLRLRNDDTGQFQFTGPGIAISGPDATDFQLTDVPSLDPMSQGEIRTFSIDFSPQTLGSKTAELLIITDSPTIPQITVPLTGTAVAERATTATGPYDGYGPGISTIGPGGDYPSLFSAVTAINSNSLTGGDWTFLITDDLIEPNNSIIGQRNTNGHSITIRPAPDTTPTVTFTTTTANPYSVHGNLVIGAQLVNLGLPIMIPHPTSNIIIDGSDIPGENHQSLTFTNHPTAMPNSLLQVFGDSDHFQIKNTRFRHAAPNIGVYLPSAIVNVAAVDRFATDDPDEVPDFGIISNCDISTSATDAVVRFAIAINARNEGPTGPYHIDPGSVGIRITSNTISNLYLGIRTHHCADVLVAHNTINIPATPPVAGTAYVSGIWCFVDQSTGGATTSTVTANTINFIGDGSVRKSMDGIRVESINTTNSIQVTNNMITGLTINLEDEPIYPIYISGIRNASDNLCTVTLAHNSIAFVQNADTQATASRCAAITNATFNEEFDGITIIQNNIIRLGTPGSCAILCYPQSTALSPAILRSDNNIIHTAPGAYVAYATQNGGTLYETLQQWQTATGQDLNSLDLDPHIPQASGLGTWHGSPADTNPDLHFTAYPGDAYNVPRLAFVPTDIDNQPRPAPLAMAGADQSPMPDSRVRDWSVY